AMRRVLERTELEDKLLSPISTLSRGYRQRVGVAQAIIHTPEFVILDEPTNGLDPQQIGHMRDLIRELAAHATVIVSTHILQEVEAVCQRVLVLRHGKLVVDTPLSALSHSHQLQATTDATLAAMKALLQGLDAVLGISELAGADHAGQQYELNLAAQPDSVAPQVARLLVDNGYQLWQLQTRRQDLETLFREANAAPQPAPQQEVAHG